MLTKYLLYAWKSSGAGNTVMNKTDGGGDRSKCQECNEGRNIDCSRSI